jgi:hypothetical protein
MDGLEITKGIGLSVLHESRTNAQKIPENRVRAYARTLFSGSSKLLHDLLIMEEGGKHCRFF